LPRVFQHIQLVQATWRAFLFFDDLNRMC
jgi:hypothetical protein